jgi:hypothetical protein
MSRRPYATPLTAAMRNIPSRRQFGGQLRRIEDRSTQTEPEPAVANNWRHVFKILLWIILNENAPDRWAGHGISTPVMTTWRDVTALVVRGCWKQRTNVDFLPKAVRVGRKSWREFLAALRNEPDQAELFHSERLCLSDRIRNPLPLCRLRN